MTIMFHLGSFALGIIVGWAFCYFYGKSRKFASKTLEKASKQ